MAVAVDVSDWICTPAPLNDRKSVWNAIFSRDKSIVRRNNPENEWKYCLCYTRGPLPPGQVWQITVLETSTRNWKNGLRVGVTATLPNEVPPFLKGDTCGAQEWNYKQTSLWHHGTIISTDLPDLNDLKFHQSVGLLLTTEGHLHVYHDGQHIEKVVTGLPVDHHMWGAVDVWGDCTKIKSQLLSENQDMPLARKQGPAAQLLSISSKTPTLPQLVEIELPSRVAPNVDSFGTLLLQDKHGNKMAIIRGNCHGRLEDMAMAVLREWLAGKGVEVSWDSLISTLKKSKQQLLAEQIQMALDQL